MSRKIIAIVLLVAGFFVPAYSCHSDSLDPYYVAPEPVDPVGYPSRDPNLDALPGFKNPPPGYGEVPFWWWTGDPLDEERLIWQIDELHKKGISGVQVNYAHDDTPGMPTLEVEPPIFSDAWWKVWGRIADECQKRGMGIGLSTYTLDWPGTKNLFRDLFYSKQELNALQLKPMPRQRLTQGQSATIDVPDDLICARAYRVEDGQLCEGGEDLNPYIRDGKLTWRAPRGEWEIWLVRAERRESSLNPLLADVGEIVIRDFYQPFQDATPTQSYEGLNYFFNDELKVGAGDRVWNDDFSYEFQTRKGYDLFDVIPALWADMGSATPKIRMDYADVRMSLMEERFFQPIYRWHASRGLIFACDSGGRGLHPNEFGDYFRATRWYSAPGHDTPGGNADLIKGKVSSSIANLYRRPRVWLEGYHSLGWGATPERLMFATRENYLYGCTLLNLHGLYYTTHGSFWEWAPPSYHFRMPYWDHMGVFLKYFERLSYLMSQGSFVSDVAILYPVAPYEAGLDGNKARDAAFNTARALMAAGVNFEFIDADSLARAQIRDGRLQVADSSYRALVFASMDAVRWTSLQKASEFAEAGGYVLNVGKKPFASDRAGRDDAQLKALITKTIPNERRFKEPADVPAAILSAFTPDVRADKTVRTLHRKVGSRDVYFVMDAAKNSTVEFRAKGCAELWDPWTGDARPLRVVNETESGTVVELPLDEYEAQVVVFTPGKEHVNPPETQERIVEEIALDGDWEFELKPTMDNRFGDFRLPAKDKIIGPEARKFRHAVESGDASSWMSPEFDDGDWQKVTYGFGPKFWVLGPLPKEIDCNALDAELAKIEKVDPGQPVEIDGKTFSWSPYSFSWRWGREGDPGHQGWHGLKEIVTDYFLCLGKKEKAFNEFKYVPEEAGNVYYLWTSATVDRSTAARIESGEKREGDPRTVSALLMPESIFVNGKKVESLKESVDLKAGANPILVRFDRAGRGFFVMKREDVQDVSNSRTPLSMRWIDDPSVIRFDVRAGETKAEWFRFTAPPGFRSMRVAAKGTVEAWADGQPMKESRLGCFETEEPLKASSVVALRVVPKVGCSGAAVFPEPIRLQCESGVAPLGDWSKTSVLETYSGGAWYRKTLTLTQDQIGDSVALDLGKVVATAEVRVNGETAGVCVSPPWRVDVTKFVKPGENQIEILVYNTLANHCLTVPTKYQGDPTSGLLGPVVLEITTKKTQ